MGQREEKASLQEEEGRILLILPGPAPHSLKLGTGDVKEDKPKPWHQGGQHEPVRKRDIKQKGLGGIERHEKNEHKAHVWESREWQKLLRSWAHTRGGTGKPEQRVCRCVLGGWGAKTQQGDMAGYTGMAEGRTQRHS